MKTRSTQKKQELGVLMLLLAADTVADVSRATLSNDGIPLPKDFANPHSSELVLSGRGRDIKISGNKLSPTYSADDSSDGDTDSVGTPVPESNDDIAELGSVRWNNRLDGALLDHIMSYTDWRTAVTARQVSRTWFTASLNAAVVCRLPQTKIPAVFIPCRVELGSSIERDEARLCGHPETLPGTPQSHTSLDCDWTCTHCSAQVSQSQMCINCGAYAPSVTRVFFGQLRRDATVPMVRWLVEDVCGAPPQSLVSVENHCHRATGRGKGCAWAYVDGADIADRVLSYHHRAFFDVVGGVEGAWVVHRNHSEALVESATLRGVTGDRPRCMPRTALVVELPARPAVPYPVPINDTMAWAAPPPPSYSEYTNDAAYWSYGVPCWDIYGQPARRNHPYATL